MKQDNEKQAIEEMAALMDGACDVMPLGECYTVDCNYCKAVLLYNADYRKQSEDVTDINVGNKSEWISVDERLPEDVYGKDRKKITVLVCTESGNVSAVSRQRIFKFNSTKLEWEELDTFEWSKRKRVTHWMPLPEPPKGAEQ